MIRMLGIGEDFEQRIEAGDTATIFERSVPFAADVARIGDGWFSGADIGNGEPMLPAVAEVVSVVDDGLSRFDQIAQPYLPGTEAPPRPSVHRRAVLLLADSEFPEMAIEPSHDGLDDVMEDLERDRGRHFDLTPDQRISMPQRDLNGGDLVEAVGCRILAGGTHTASLAGRAFQFQQAVDQDCGCRDR